MPRKIVLECDKPDCKTPGTEYRISDTKGMVAEVIVCDAHLNEPMRDVVSWGHLIGAAEKRSRGRKPSGTSRERLASLRVD